jgi:serine protease Do
MYGQVIGITSSKYATTYTEGLGFAITINEAKPIIEELITKGYVSGRVRIGITFYESYANYMNIMFEEEFGFEIPKELENALWIKEISKDCDISNTELKANDFILEMNGLPISNYDGIEAAIDGLVGGDTVTAKCARVSDNGEISYFDITFKLMEDTSGNY